MSEPIVVTATDLDRLHRLVEQSTAAHVEALDQELGRAQVVEPGAIPPDVVTMRSRVRFRDEGNGEEREVTLVYPQDADASRGKVSVLAPVGCALLGLRVGQSIDWPVPSGIRRLKVVEVLYQPEAAGDFDR